eukprot:6200780-Pleurochrysis_carterae.AAC.5
MSGVLALSTILSIGQIKRGFTSVDLKQVIQLRCSEGIAVEGYFCRKLCLHLLNCARDGQ